MRVLIEVRNLAIRAVDDDALSGIESFDQAVLEGEF
jgi:hypothetical protein